MTSDPTRRLAARYLWWKSNPASEADIDRLIAQVMDIGDFDDANLLLDHFGELRFRKALKSAPAGRLRPKSWAYWHYRLGLTPVDETPPPLPRRPVE